MFQLLDQIPYIEHMLGDLESYTITEGLMVMKANSETITSVNMSSINQHLSKLTIFLLSMFQGS